jgi:hypothetical protein
VIENGATELGVASKRKKILSSKLNCFNKFKDAEFEKKHCFEGGKYLTRLSLYTYSVGRGSKKKKLVETNNKQNQSEKATKSLGN